MYRNLLHFCTLTVNYQGNLKNNPIYNFIKKNKNPRNKSKEVEGQYNPYQLPMAFFAYIEQKVKISWNHKRPQIAKPMLRRKNGAGGLRLPDFVLYYNALVMKTVWYWHKDKPVDQWSSIENPEINPYICGQLIYVKGGETEQWREDS